MPASKSSPDAVHAKLRLMHALSLRRDGASFQEIAEKAGYPNPKAAYEAVRWGMKAEPRMAAEDERQNQLASLNSQKAVALEIQRRALDDDKLETALKCIGSIVRIEERIAKLLGLDEPERVNIAAMVVRMAAQRGIILTQDELQRAVELAERGATDMQNGTADMPQLPPGIIEG